MNLIKKILGWFLDWPILVIEAVALIVLCWPWANHVVSYFWASILLLVLLDEAISYFFFPERKTISEHIREQVKKDPVRFWAMNILWMLFASTLTLHFCSRIFGA